MHIELSVSGQRLRREMGPGIVGGSRYYLTAHVSFAGHDWDGAQVWLRIDQAGTQNAFLLDDQGCVTADRGINLAAGCYQMSLLGIRGETRITTNAVPLTVTRSGLDGGDPLPGVPKTAAEQIAALAQEAADTARSVREDADAGLFDGADGVPGKDGKDGAPGRDGIDVTHAWDGTVLEITSASGTSSVDLRGPKGETGPQGERGETGPQGIQGDPGKDAPQDAVRYGEQALTDAQQAKARGNIGAASDEALSRVKDDLEKQKNFFDEIIGKNLFNPDDKEAGYYIINQTTGAIAENINRFTTGYIPLRSGESVIFTYDFHSSAGTTKRAKRTCYSLVCYNANKELLYDTVTSSVSEYTANNEEIAYIRVCFYANNLNINLMIEYGSSITDYEPYKIEYRLKEENRNLGFDKLSEKVIKNETDISKLLNNVRAYLPDVIYCAVGRTIEIYNQYVCLNDKYHINWVCDIGKALKRKFSIKGTEALIGDYQLTLNICDDELNVVWSKTATLKIVSDVLSESHNINPIGDSLTNNKLWEGECQRLSAGKVQYVGTNAFSQSIEGGNYTGGHEGYPGVAGNFFLSETNGFYTNPYYTDSDNVFDVSGYMSRNNISIDAIQIMLGTNGIAGYDARISEIKSMIEHIRAWNMTIPIFVVAPIYRGNQNGFGVQTNNEGYAVQTGRYEYEYRTYSFKMIENEEKMVKELNDSNIHFIPLGLYHDGEYNFGTVPTPVNPRCEVTESMPTESVHPQPCGQLQMADELFSTYCGILG